MSRAVPHHLLTRSLLRSVALRWKAVSVEEKATYDDMAKVDKLRWTREQKKWEGDWLPFELGTHRSVDLLIPCLPRALSAEHGAPEARTKPKPTPKPKKSKVAKAPKPTEDSSENDEPATTSGELHQATKPRVLPMPLLELGTHAQPVEGAPP